MNDRLRESVSALMDGEADELELRRLLASDDGVVRTAWRDFHLTRDSMHGVDMQFAHIDISQRVQVALADELAAAPARNIRWWRPVASFAVAASVATVVAVGARHFSSDVDGGSAIAQASTPATSGRVFVAPVQQSVGNVAVSATINDSAVPQNSLDPDQLAQQRLQQYLLEHSERAALNNGQGVITFARVSQLDASQH